MWQTNWREHVWSHIEQPWDIIIIGGGITGAGILREATRMGLKALLVEQGDFGSGTSSRSSKLVHGGLRYLAEGKVGLTRASVHEREHLLEEGPGLIDPLGFLLATYKGDRPGRWTYRAGLSIYDLLALQWSHRYYSALDFQMLAPHISPDGLQGGFRYGDAQTDDARLVLRVIKEAIAGGGAALNYAQADQLLCDPNSGLVCGIHLRDKSPSPASAGEGWGGGRAPAIPGEGRDIYAKVVVNATGAWADQLRSQVYAPPRLRPLRGSHLIFPAWRLPVAQALGFLHPVDHRPIFIFPWEGITLVGTTDVDHDASLDDEPGIRGDEVAYLMAALEAEFPSLHLKLEDVTATFSGVRPIVNSGKADPSKESRDHVVWDEEGLLTVTGGKLTTFRLIALDALKAIRYRLPGMPPLKHIMPALDQVNVPLPGAEHLSEQMHRRLLGRYGADAPALVTAAKPGELELIPATHYLWAELRWAARAEGVVRLDDLMLRRVRLGLLYPEGGRSLLPRIRAICQPELGWDAARWQAEESAYRALWRKCYSLPNPATIPDWHAMVNRPKPERRLVHAHDLENAA